MDVLLSLTFVFTILKIFLVKVSNSLDTIAPPQFLSDGNTLVSRDKIFELGFFSSDASENRYLGIWYANMPVRTVVWVANRNNPINTTSGLLTISSTGDPVLLDNKTVVWSASNFKNAAQDPVLQLLDSGNLVLRNRNDGNLGKYLWQSFDYPSDTLLPGMKFGWDFKTGLNRYLTSWRSSDDPALGDFTWKVQHYNNPELVMWKGTEKVYRSGPWTGISFSGGPALRQNGIFNFDFVSTDEELYYIFTLKNPSLLTRMVMNQTTNERYRYTWNQLNKTWSIYAIVPRDRCDRYGLCGPYGTCNINELPVCQCLKGFRPKALEAWNLMDWTNGCVRNKPISCQNGSADAFVKFVNLKLPDVTHSWVNRTMNLKECETKCLQNCSCTAYSSLDVRNGGSGCAIWFENLIDMKQFESGGQDLYIRMNTSEKEENSRPKLRIGLIVLASIVIVIGIMIIIFHIKKRKTKYCTEQEDMISSQHHNEDRNSQNQDMDLRQFELSSLIVATNDFSIDKKIGEGGFGPVYKGTLPDGKEIAVKKQSKTSGQGLSEFKNEVKLIAKLQHRNLVKLLGCCIEGEEKILVYEYMPNRSLDSFIFDKARSKMLNWGKRYSIICGIARGLLYLHQDSRLRIIHRDLKTSNVLLDKDMNPKISDFGMAKTFGGEQILGNTNRVVGTYGYMAPEYATDGIFSVKSDVFSFGVLVLEIISGKRSRGFYHPNAYHSLIGNAWKLWKEGKSIELLDDSAIEDSCNISQITRCFHISLLCVQQNPDDRPGMASVVLMLGSEIALPQPNQPGFFQEKGSVGKEYSSSNFASSSTNDISFSCLQPR